MLFEGMSRICSANFGLGDFLSVLVIHGDGDQDRHAETNCKSSRPRECPKPRLHHRSGYRKYTCLRPSAGCRLSLTERGKQVVRRRGEALMASGDAEIVKVVFEVI